MKTAQFTMQHMRAIYEGEVVRQLHVPTLTAYAIEYVEFSAPPHLDLGHIEYLEGRNFRVEGDHILFLTPPRLQYSSVQLGNTDVRLLVHHHGIREYGLLFPQIPEQTLKKRLGEFYEESEKAFGVAAWLSFALSAAAIYEGLLEWRLGAKRGNLAELAEDAFQRRLIDEHERRTIDIARRARNLVHAARHKAPFVSRMDAMDMRTVLDRVIRSFSTQLPEPKRAAVKRNHVILVPTTSAADWKRLLADPEKQWRTGFSARALAYAWQEAEELPAEVRGVLGQKFSDVRVLLCIPEHKVSLPGGGRASQTDLWVLARSGEDLISIAVEGKVSEAFGPTVDEWLVDASPGKRGRLNFLGDQLGFAREIPGTARYQLLHRAASAILEARRFHARHAVLLVHSFSPAREWLNDFVAFGALLGLDAGPDRLTPARECGGVNFSIGWVSGDPAFLSR